MTSATNDQQEICKRFSVTPIAPPQDMKVGISRNVRDGMHPINGLGMLPPATPPAGISGPAKNYPTTPTSSSPCMYPI